jgi:hypothetical protein
VREKARRSSLRAGPRVATFAAFLSLGACELAFPLDLGPSDASSDSYAADGRSITDAPGVTDSAVGPDAMPDSTVGSDAADAAAPDAAADTSHVADGSCDASYRTRILCDNPVAYWRLDEPGPSIAADQVDGGPSATYAGLAGMIGYGVPGALLTDTDTAIHLSGSNWLNAGNGSALEFTGNVSYSLEAWVSPDAPTLPGSTSTVMARYASTALTMGEKQTGYTLWSQGAQLSTGRYADDASTTAIGGPPDAGVYTHVVATYSANSRTLQLFVNGVSIGKTGGAPDLNADTISFLVGASSVKEGGTDTWAGRIDEVAIYAYPLTGTQVLTHYRVSGRP